MHKVRKFTSISHFQIKLHEWYSFNFLTFICVCTYFTCILYIFPLLPVPSSCILNNNLMSSSCIRQLGASLQTIEVESRKLEELKAIVFQDFRREVLNKLKKQSESRVSAGHLCAVYRDQSNIHLNHKSIIYCYGRCFLCVQGNQRFWDFVTSYSEKGNG